jgi:hypothetical protein
MPEACTGVGGEAGQSGDDHCKPGAAPADPATAVPAQGGGDERGTTARPVPGPPHDANGLFLHMHILSKLFSQGSHQQEKIATSVISFVLCVCVCVCVLFFVVVFLPFDFCSRIISHQLLMQGISTVFIVNPKCQKKKKKKKDINIRSHCYLCSIYAQVFPPSYLFPCFFRCF